MSIVHIVLVAVAFFALYRWAIPWLFGAPPKAYDAVRAELRQAALASGKLPTAGDDGSRNAALSGMKILDTDKRSHDRALRRRAAAGQQASSLS